MDTRSLPMPGKVYLNLPTLFENGFYVHILASLYRIFVGLLISIACGNDIIWTWG